MRPVTFHTSTLLEYFKKEKIADLAELKQILGTNTTMTVLRKLKQLDYISSCSHSGKYYTLKQIAKFNANGLWSIRSVLFSQYKDLKQTIKMLIENSKTGLTAIDLENELYLKPNEVLLKLVNNKDVSRKKLAGKYVYFSKDKRQSKRQEQLHKESLAKLHVGKMKPELLFNELKAVLILFYSILNEKQRRLFAGLESIRAGTGGDTMIADLFGLNIKTVSKGKKELLQNKIIIDTIIVGTVSIIIPRTTHLPGCSGFKRQVQRNCRVVDFISPVARVPCRIRFDFNCHAINTHHRNAITCSQLYCVSAVSRISVSGTGIVTGKSISECPIREGSVN